MVTAPYTTITASARGADAYAELPPAVTPRKLTGLTVNGPRGAAIVIYMGFVSPSSRIDQNINGFNNNQDYASPRSDSLRTTRHRRMAEPSCERFSVFPQHFM
jgi:hypothetical protein